MPRARATSSALWRSREAIAVTSLQSPFCMAGTTFLTPIPAVLRTPQRTLFGISANDKAATTFLKAEHRLRPTHEALKTGLGRLLLLAAGPHRIALFQKS